MCKGRIMKPLFTRDWSVLSDEEHAVLQQLYNMLTIR